MEPLSTQPVGLLEGRTDPFQTSQVVHDRDPGEKVYAFTHQ